MKKHNIALIDDHKLFREGLAQLINGFQGFEVVLEADNGKDFIIKLNLTGLPDIVVLDINMKEMDGYETASWIKKNYPNIKILALSMYENENAIIRMLRSGAGGYVLKNIRKQELLNALLALAQKGYYNSELISGKLIRAINNFDGVPDGNSTKQFVSLSEREIEFLKWVCSDLTYKDIAHKMNLSTHTIDGYRDALFEKLEVKSRVGLVLYSIKNKIFMID